MIAAYTIAVLLIAGVATGAFASARHHAHQRPITEQRRRQIDAYQARYGVHDPRPPT